MGDTIIKSRLPLQCHDDRCVVAGPDVRLHDTARRPGGDDRRDEEIIETPADVARAQIAPRRPPGEQILIVRIELAAHVHELGAEQGLEQSALLGALATAFGFRSLGCTSISLRAMFMSPHTISCLPSAVSRAAQSIRLFTQASLAG